MKTIILILFSFISHQALSQIFGQILLDRREVQELIDFTVPYSKEGKLVFDIRVNVDGKVTSCELVEEKSTITAMGPMIQAKNKIIQHLVFKKGIGYPEFHKGYVQINTVQGTIEKNDKFAPPN